MCGIAGTYLFDHAKRGVAEAAVKSMCTRMHRRGPDAEHVRAFDQGRVALGHRRLAILDLDPRSDQPMISADGKTAIVFNGEIYNFQSLRSELERDGAAFRTSSDTEVILQLYERNGPAMLDRLRGMFALAIWNTETRSLFLARDPYGIKPLYVAQNKDGLAFASQVKALLASGLVSEEADTAGVAGFYLSGHVPEPFTLYRSVRALPAGHWMKVKDGQVTEQACWHDIRSHWSSPSSAISASDLEEHVKQVVKDSVAAHLVSDVPVSVFLSGGIDSSAVAGHVAAQGNAVEGITIGFEEFAGQQDDEVPVAGEIAGYYDLPHTVRTVSQQEFQSDLPNILDAMDQPSVDGVNSWFASKAAAEQGYKVVLSGVGGDELFCGYKSFRQIPRLAQLGRLCARVPGLQLGLKPLARAVGNRRNNPKLAALIDYWDSVESLYSLRRGLFLPHELPDLMGVDEAPDGLERLAEAQANIAAKKARDGSAAIGMLESTRYLRNQLLRDSDWASMAHSLELRTPLVDAPLLMDLAPYTAGFTNGRGKAMLARSPARPMPEHILTRRKTGFSVPMVRWLSETAGGGVWNRVPMLRNPATPWARRWAYALQQQNSWRTA